MAQFQVCSISQAHFLNNRSHFQWYLLVVILTLNQAQIALGVKFKFLCNLPSVFIWQSPTPGLKAMESPAVFCNIVENQIIKHPISLISVMSIRGF